MKKIGIGYEEYKRFIDDDMYYIDKTMLISDIVEKGGEVTLFTRPRRFGKTLALSMLRTFFELEYDYNGNVIDKRRYFEGKKIMNAGDKILSMMGKYPVIKLSLKSAKQPDFRSAALQLRDEIISEFSRHIYVKNSDALTEEEAKLFNELSVSKRREDLKKDEDEMKKELDILINGGTIEKQIHEDITYDDIHESEDNLWNFLFFTGYMKKVSERSEDNGDIYLTMKIPNVEIASIYRGQIRGWFDKQVKSEDRSVLHKAVLEGDTDVVAEYVTKLLKKSISVFDNDESFYHGFFLSLLYGTPDYVPQSNREEGDGRPDIVLYPENPTDPAIIFEIKVRKKFNEMEGGLNEAYEQIKDKKYEEGVLDDGYMGVKSYGICFCKKSCIVGKYDK